MVNLIAKCDRQSIPVADNQVGFNRWAGWHQAGHLPDGAELGRLGVSDGGGWSIFKIVKLEKKVNSHTQSQAGNSGAGDQVLFHWQVMFHVWICPGPESDFSCLAAPHSYLRRQWDTSWWNCLPLADLRVALKLRGMSDCGKGAESVSEIAFPDG